jgi:predicted dehydrogenase
MKEPIVVGVVGCGYWGPNLVRNFKGLTNCHLRAMCDTSEARLKHMRSLYADVEGITDFDHLLNGVGLDAVVVATPVKYHYPLAKASLLAGKHTLIEKPMASSSAECEELIEIAQRKGLVLMVGHTFLYSARYVRFSRLSKPETSARSATSTPGGLIWDSFRRISM